MNTKQSHDEFAELRKLIAQLRDGQPTPEQGSQLQKMLAESTSARRVYARYSAMQALLELAIPSLEAERPATIPVGLLDSGLPATIEEQQSQESAPPVVFPTLGSFDSTLGYCSSDWRVAYLIATVICGVGALIGALTYVSQPEQVALESRPVANHRVVSLPTIQKVGQITGMRKCKWAGPKTTPATYAVSLDQTFALDSGLLEITYDSGAKVILQGPVTYKVNDANGGFLSQGKLTARVESRESREKSKDKVASKSEILNPSLFTINTPSAVVTDLGTEFGVEVSEEGSTTSRVFCGLVKVQAVAVDGKAKGAVQVLHEGEAARVDNRSNQGDGNRISMLTPSTAKYPSFVRKMPIQTTKIFDLVDVVAGGDGFLGKRGAGIDPATGRAVDKPLIPVEQKDFHTTLGNGKYHRVEGLPFVDGVFIPDSNNNSVQIDSAGHVFTYCPKTDNQTCNLVWAGGAIPAVVPTGSVYTLLDGIDYAARDHGLLYVHPNAGITFDLEAIRRSNPGWTIRKFLAVAGNPGGSLHDIDHRGESTCLDFWILVDGQVRLRRRKINYFNGGVSIAVPIAPNDQFLTLVGTDGGDGCGYDQLIFGDPRLELIDVKDTQQQTPP